MLLACRRVVAQKNKRRPTVATTPLPVARGGRCHCCAMKRVNADTDVSSSNWFSRLADRHRCDPVHVVYVEPRRRSAKARHPIFVAGKNEPGCRSVPHRAGGADVPLFLGYGQSEKRAY